MKVIYPSRVLSLRIYRLSLSLTLCFPSGIVTSAVLIIRGDYSEK